MGKTTATSIKADPPTIYHAQTEQVDIVVGKNHRDASFSAHKTVLSASPSHRRAASLTHAMALVLRVALDVFKTPPSKFATTNLVAICSAMPICPRQARRQPTKSIRCVQISDPSNREVPCLKRFDSPLPTSAPAKSSRYLMREYGLPVMVSIWAPTIHIKLLGYLSLKTAATWP